MTEKHEHKYCPLRNKDCGGEICALWDKDLPGCSVLSIAKELAMMREEYETRRRVKLSGF